MKTMLRLFVVVLLLGGWALAAAALHLLITPGPIPWLGGAMLVPKDHLSYRETFADVRKWNAGDLVSHPAITSRLQQLHKTELLDRIERVTTPAAQPPATQPTVVTTAQ